MGKEDKSNTTNYDAQGTYEKRYFVWDTYKWCVFTNSTLTKYCNDSNYGNLGFADGLTELELSDDAASVCWGSKWRTPTSSQQRELINECTWTWTRRNGVDGYEVVGPNGNSIFLPATGSRYEYSSVGEGTIGNYWSCSLDNTPDRASGLSFNSGAKYWLSADRCEGLTIRPVRLSE